MAHKAISTRALLERRNVVPGQPAAVAKTYGVKSRIDGRAQQTSQHDESGRVVEAFHGVFETEETLQQIGANNGAYGVAYGGRQGEKTEGGAPPVCKHERTEGHAPPHAVAINQDCRQGDPCRRPD
jgi:hypothetical protein